MAKDTILTKDFSSQKIPSEKQSCFNDFSEKGVVGALLADDLINLLALAVIEVEHSNNTTCS